MKAFIAFFKGINVGGNKKVKMEDLKDVFASAGMKNVRTFIQSGNVVFSSKEADEKKLISKIEEAFALKFGFESSVILRSGVDIRKISSSCPIPNYEEKNPSFIMVNFLSEQPETSLQKSFVESWDGTEEIYFKGKEMYIYYPAGSGRSKLTGNLIEKKLKITATSRNWNTVQKLNEIMAEENK